MFLHGANGQGKTNFLEALGLATALRPFRTHENRIIIGPDGEQSEACFEIESERAGELGKAGLSRHLETSGCREISGEWDWITLSPKREAIPVQSALENADEFKLIIDNDGAIDEWVAFLSDQIDERPIWLHPEWSQHSHADILNRITSFVKKSGYPFRAGVQAHKFYQADTLDPRSASPKPLGGDPKLGY